MTGAVPFADLPASWWEDSVTTITYADDIDTGAVLYAGPDPATAQSISDYLVARGRRPLFITTGPKTTEPPWEDKG